MTLRIAPLSKPLLACLLLLFAGVSNPALAARTLEEPAPISVPVGKTALQVANAIRRAAAALKFTIDEDAQGRMVARYAPRDHVARVTIAYSTSEVRVTYLDSSNLGFEQNKDGTREIHRNYNKWVNNLAQEINKNLSSGNY